MEQFDKRLLSSLMMEHRTSLQAAKEKLQREMKKQLEDEEKRAA